MTPSPDSGLEADVALIRWAILDAPKNRAVEAEQALARLVKQLEALSSSPHSTRELVDTITTALEGDGENSHYSYGKKALDDLVEQLGFYERTLRDISQGSGRFADLDAKAALERYPASRSSDA